MKRLHFVALGCPKNLVDAEVMLGHLINSGFTLTDDPTVADVIVVNTCAFIEDAKKEAIDILLEMGAYRKSGNCHLLVASGCLPQRYRGELAALLPEVDVFVGAGEFARIAEIIDRWVGKQELHVRRPVYLYDHETPRFGITPRHAAYLKIAEGCFHPCSFCIIPKIRGGFRSRRLESVVEEARRMLAAGVRELNLIAQDTTAYGRDIGTDLSALLERLASLPGQKWIRTLYAYPHNFPRSVIDAMRDYSDICKYLDIPIQHVSDRILKSMRRGGTGADIRRFIETLRRDVPGVALRTSLITGYPGESQREHDELLDFVCEMRFEHLGVFAFSPEEGTLALRLKRRVAPIIAEGRRREIMDAQREISLSNNERLLGRKLPVLVDGPSPESGALMIARHEAQAPDIDGVVYINEGEVVPGKFAEVTITEAHEYDLVGRAEI